MLTGLIFFAFLCMAGVNPDEWRAFAERVKEMFRLHGIGWTKGCELYMGVPVRQFQRWLDGSQKFDMRHVYLLPKDMRATLNYLELREHGLPGWINDAARIAAAVKKDVA